MSLLARFFGHRQSTPPPPPPPPEQQDMLLQTIIQERLADPSTHINQIMKHLRENYSARKLREMLVYDDGSIKKDLTLYFNEKTFSFLETMERDETRQLYIELKNISTEIFKKKGFRVVSVGLQGSWQSISIYLEYIGVSEEVDEKETYLF